jgi:hypothetical protein
MSETKTDQSVKIDYLSEDELPEGSHKFACYSFLSPEGVKNCTLRGLKCRGTFPDEKSAREACEVIRKKHPNHHIFLAPVGFWVPFEADPSKCKEENYLEKELQELSKAYLENREKAKEAEEQRRKEMMEKAIADSKKNKLQQQVERMREKLQKSREKESNKNDDDDNVKEDPEFKKKEEEIKKESSKITEENNKLEKTESNIKTLDDKISKIREIYRNMKEKEKK